LYNSTEQIQHLHHVCIPFTRLHPLDLTPLSVSFDAPFLLDVTNVLFFF
jgi:hypothetical protein